MRRRRGSLAVLALLGLSGQVRPGEPPAGAALGCRDVGIWSDLDPEVRLALPPDLDRDTVHFVVDGGHGLVVLYAGARPRKIYPLGGPRSVVLGERGELGVALRAADAAELAPWVSGRPARELARGEAAPPGDRDDDGIPDPLDVVVGTKKLLENGAEYVEGWKSIAYPGDVPREMGVCTDVIVRALRNAGLDLQVELQRDIASRPRAYPFVKRRNPQIDHRRVRTILPYFSRHWERHGVDPRAADDPFEPGDIVFFDTFPSRDGPDHVGIVSDTVGDGGLPLIVNNWTTGTRDAEMDLLAFVPVTDRFRMK